MTTMNSFDCTITSFIFHLLKNNNNNRTERYIKCNTFEVFVPPEALSSSLAKIKVNWIKIFQTSSILSFTQMVKDNIVYYRTNSKSLI